MPPLAPGMKKASAETRLPRRPLGLYLNRPWKKEITGNTIVSESMP